MDSVAPAASEGTAISVSEAAGLLSKRSRPVETQETPEAAPVPESAPEPESEPVEGQDAAPPEAEPSGETEGEEDPAGEPPIDPPRSLSKEDQKAFQDLPRTLQQRWAAIERSRELEVRRLQNDAADQRKAIEAKEAAAEKARQSYEAALPALQNTELQALMREFADIKSDEDLAKLAQSNPQRYLKFDAQLKKVQRISQAANALNQQKQAEEAKAWEKFTADEDAKFFEAAPEFSDPTTGPQLQNEALSLLKERGFSEDELTRYFHGAEKISVRDHRVQLLVRDAVKYRAAQKAAKEAKAKPQTPVTRPGVAPAKGAQKAAAVQELQTKLARSGKVTDAVAFLKAKRAK